jgi:hypothetical protein
LKDIIINYKVNGIRAIDTLSKPVTSSPAKTENPGWTQDKLRRRFGDKDAGGIFGREGR